MYNYNIILTEQQKESYSRLSLEIAKSESSLKDMNTELKNMNKIDLTKVKDTLKKVGDVALDVVKKVGQVTAAVGGAMAGVVAAGVKSYAELEQNVGGIKTLFGEETAKDELKNFSIVTFDHLLEDKDIGTIGIIGPTRMDYSKVISVMKYISKKINDDFKKGKF